MTSLSEDLAEFNELCRVCANKTNVLLALNIFEGDGSNRAIYKKINKCLPIKVSMEDKLPKLICEECVYKLDLLNEFQDISSKTEVFLNNLLNRIFLTTERKAQSLLGVSCGNLVPINMSHVLEGQDKVHCISNDLDSSLTSSQLGDAISLKSEPSHREEGESITYIVTAEPLEGATFFFCVLCSKTFGDRNAFDSHCADTHWNKCEPCGLLFTSQDAHAMHCADIHSMDKPSMDVSFILSHMESYRQLPQSIPLTPVLSHGTLVGATLAPGSSLAPGDLPTISLTSGSRTNVVTDLEQLGRSNNSIVDTSTLPNSNARSTSSNESTSSIPFVAKIDHTTIKHAKSNTLGHSTKPSSNSELSSDVTNAFDSVNTSLSEYSSSTSEKEEEGGVEKVEVRDEDEEEDGSSCDEPLGDMHGDSEDDQDDPMKLDKTKLNNDLKQDHSKEQTERQKEASKQPTKGLSKQLSEGRINQQIDSEMDSKPVPPLYKCPLCGQQFVLKKTYESHVLSHGIKSMFQCSTCNKQFRSKIG
ncbi:hypothetical protein WDU94_005076, partial [Cyamophila willieti]